MKDWSVNKMHRCLLGGIFLVAQLMAVAHLPVHALESLQVSNEVSNDEQTVQLELCSICLVADYLDSSVVETAQPHHYFSPSQLTTGLAANGLNVIAFSLYSARAPPSFS